jgi:hypothetical protein
MRYAIAIAVALAIAIAIYLAGRGGDAKPQTAGSSTSTSTSTTAHAAPPRHVTKLASPEERARIASEIAAARATHHAAPAPPSLPKHEIDLESYAQDSLVVLKEAIPFLAACYDAAGGSDGGVAHKARVQMSLVGDRDVGTLIDTERMVDANGEALEAGLASCLKTTLESLELPPLAEGDELKIEYSFRLGD